MSKPTVAVFFGGNSNEHEISVITGMLATNLLRGAEYEVVPVYLPKTGGMVTSQKMRGVEDFRTPEAQKFTPVRLSGNTLVRDMGRGKRVAHIDVALNCCHGGMGEDGTLSALLAWHGVKLASPAMPVSAIFMNKHLSKHAAKGLGLPVLDSFTVGEAEWRASKDEILARADEFGYPVVVKPVRLGSSVGISVAKNSEGLAAALALAFRLDEDALVEKYLAERRDINCAACLIGGKTEVSLCEEAFSQSDILTFAEKYEGGATRRSALPAELDEELSEKIRTYTRLIYETFRIRGVVRADFLVAGEEVYFNELNTVPGSLSCYLFGKTLTESRSFLVSLVEEGLKSELPQKEILQSGILHEGIFSGGKGCKRRRNLL